MLRSKLDISPEVIEEFCRRWQINELSLFGSVLRDDFLPASDVDVMVTFAPHTKHSLFDLGEMQMELVEIFGRPVDLVEKAGLRNPFRRRAILQSAEVIYAGQ